MSNNVSIKIEGDKELMRKLQQFGPSILRAVAPSLHRSAELIMAESKDQYCPVETGTLRSTGFVRSPDTAQNNVSVTLGYGGPSASYALAVHENPRAGKTGGVSPSGAKYKRWAKTGQWKYLETPVKANVNNVRNELIHDIDIAIKGLS